MCWFNFVTEKTEMFLELFGNLTIRKQSSEYVEKMANEFIKWVVLEHTFYVQLISWHLWTCFLHWSIFSNLCRMVTDFDILHQKLPMLDLSQLKVSTFICSIIYELPGTSIIQILLIFKQGHLQKPRGLVAPLLCLFIFWKVN